MVRGAIIKLVLASLFSCICAHAQLLIHPGSGLGPFVLGKTFEENNKNLRWKNAVVERDKTNKKNIHLIYSVEGITFFYTQQDKKGQSVASFRTSILDSIEITSFICKVDGSGLAVGKKIDSCTLCEKSPAANSFVCDSSATKTGIKYFCDSLCTIAFIRVVPTSKAP
jgi:hypothetical protein